MAEDTQECPKPIITEIIVVSCEAYFALILEMKIRMNGVAVKPGNEYVINNPLNHDESIIVDCSDDLGIKINLKKSFP